jgi:hypothetical protein
VCLPVRFLAAPPTVAHELASRTGLRIDSGNDGRADSTGTDLPTAFLHAVQAECLPSTQFAITECYNRLGPVIAFWIAGRWKEGVEGRH